MRIGIKDLRISRPSSDVMKCDLAMENRRKHVRSFLHLTIYVNNNIYMFVFACLSSWVEVDYRRSLIKDIPQTFCTLKRAIILIYRSMFGSKKFSLSETTDSVKLKHHLVASAYNKFKHGEISSKSACLVNYLKNWSIFSKQKSIDAA